MNFKSNFDEKIVFIVGGFGLLGKEIVNEFLNQKAKIVVLDLKKKYSSDKIFYEKLDVSKYNSLKKNFVRICKKHGTPNILINTSYPKTKDWKKNSYEKVTEKSFLKNIQAHLNSYIWISKIAADLMEKNNIKDCSIINMASIYGFLGQDSKLYENISEMKESITYPVIKGGIINSCRSMAAYYGQYNIRINCISPGGIFDNQNKKFVKRYKDKTPLKRMGTPSDIVGSVLFLASKEASYITGINLVVDGGFSII